MNVDDIAGDIIPTDFSELDRLDLIFARQHALMGKYVHIEHKNRLGYGAFGIADAPVDIHNGRGQAIIKDFFWRTTEELTEACEAARIHSDIKSHILEELADALHFLVEAHLLAGITPREIMPVGDACKLESLMFENSIALEPGCFEVIYLIGAASNCLKQRPWKQTHQLVDVPKFRRYLTKTIPMLMRVFSNEGLSADEVFRIYWKKSEVNKFRQRSNY